MQPESDLEFWLEPLGKKHLRDFHELYSDEQAALWSSQRHTGTLEASAGRLSKALTHDAEKPWLISCAVMSSIYSRLETHNSTPVTTPKMIGVIKTTRATPSGLSIGYKLRSDCWGRGYATRAVGAFLNVYWSQPRWALRKEVVVQHTLGSREASVLDFDTLQDGAPKRDENAVKRASGLDGEDVEIEITHLIAQVDPENIGSMRVAEKCGGKLVSVDRGCVKVWRFPEMRDMAVWRFDKPSANVESI
ncbi:gnat family protein [Colletotrichum incanum]|uniref:Gnat family protein n=1 Tax=Colletotrichum incanum TaxID=1573173 RepID=A0A162NVL5_COLIC|nr:gnat family protein [Colletotrichum incanum]